jgi:hypothetical protein
VIDAVRCGGEEGIERIVHILRVDDDAEAQRRETFAARKPSGSKTTLRRRSQAR